MISRLLLFFGQVLYLYRGSPLALSLIEAAKKRTARIESRKQEYREGLEAKAKANAAKTRAAKAGHLH